MAIVQNQVLVMRHPTFKYDEFEIRYKQVPYDNRYFFVYHRKILVATLSCTYAYAWLMSGYPFIDPTDAGIYKRFEKFVGRCDEYDKWLDDSAVC